MTEIPWGEAEGLGEEWFRDQGKICNATSQQVVFAACYHAGWTATAAAKAAKYSGNDDSIRQAGHRASHSSAVQALLGLAHSVSGIGPTGSCEIAEVKAILSRIARQGDSNSRLRACETLARIHENEQKRDREYPEETDIHAELRAIEALSPELAKSYAESKGIKWGSNE
jgi:hypothetical protein